MVKRLAFVVPGDLAAATGGYGYDRQIIAGLRTLGWQVDVVNPGDGFPFPASETLREAQEMLLAIPRDAVVVIDGLAMGVMPEAAQRLSLTHHLVALVHHPLALELGLTAEQSAALAVQERAALAAARHVIVTSPATARTLSADFSVAPERITVVLPGTARAPAASGSTDGIVRLVAVGSVIPRKGFDVLVDALARVKGLPWHLSIAGDTTRDSATATALKQQINRLELADRITMLGTLSAEALDRVYGESDAFVLASHYEGYGMAYAEALSHGLPVLGTTGGAISDTVPPEAGILVEPGNSHDLAQALSVLILDAQRRAEFAAGARTAAARLPTWVESSALFSAALNRTRTE